MRTSLRLRESPRLAREKPTTEEVIKKSGQGYLFHIEYQEKTVTYRGGISENYFTFARDALDTLVEQAKVTRRHQMTIPAIHTISSKDHEKNPVEYATQVTLDLTYDHSHPIFSCVISS